MCQVDWTAIAAWVQAIGSVIAIAAAIYIGERSSRRSRDLVEHERRRQADIFASTFSTRIGLQAQEAEHKAKHAARFVERPANSTDPDQDVLKAIFLLPNARELLEQKRDCLLFDRGTGITVMTALDVLSSYNPTVETMIDMYAFRLGEQPDLPALCSEIRNRLTFVAESLRQAEQQLESAHGLVDEGEF